MKQVTLIKANGDESSHEFNEVAFPALRTLVDYEAFDVVNLRDGRVMLVDDEGHIRQDVPPVNKKATELYHSVCRPGTTWPIVGDVLICNDGDFA